MYSRFTNLHRSMSPFVGSITNRCAFKFRNVITPTWSTNSCCRGLISSANLCNIKIYTRTGDKGKSSLYNGERRAKDDEVFTALGTVDEVSSHLGLAKEYAEGRNHEYADQLERIQCILQDIGALIATPIPLKELEDAERQMKRKERLSFSSRHILELEEWIDQYTAALPPLTNFILPGGGKASASLHVTRSVCRRAERSITSLVSQGILDEQVLAYINRLSDYLFTVARLATVLDGLKETIYIRPQSQLKQSDQNNNELKGNQEIISHT